MTINLPSLVGKVISGCEILEKTAEGGMGAVYRAKHRALNRIVCVKILSPALSNDKKAVELFLTEARAIAELDHPNIVNVYNVGKEHGYYFIVMSFIEGQTLSAMLKKNKVLPVSKVLDLFDGVLQGLEAAHAKGIIHRDIKPSNILITPKGQAKLVDFGIAKKVDKESGSTKTSELSGTSYFIAPEQALGQNLTTRADLYSIGASLYYVLTGKFPYNGKSTLEIIQKHLNNPVPNPAEIRKDLPAWLGPAIQKLMSKNPDERFQTAKETYLYFRQMRADDQFRFESGSGGKAVDLGGESAMLVVTEERHSTQTLRAMQNLTNTMPTQPTINNSSMPTISADISDDNTKKSKPTKKKESARSTAPMPSTENTISEQKEFVPAIKKEPFFTSATRQKLRNFLFFFPLFAVFSGVLSYTFYVFGRVCSVHVSTQTELLKSFVAPLFAGQYAPNQFSLLLACVVLLVLVFASSFVKAFSRSFILLLFLAGISYVAGLLTPQIPFMELNQMVKFLFSPEYYLCYLVLAFAWGISLCWTFNRSVAQGILGAALVIFCMGMAFASANLTLPPDSQNILFTIVFYASLFCGICAIYYLISRVYKDSILLPSFLFIVAVFGIWTYTVSGLASSIENTLGTLISRVEVSSFSERGVTTPTPEVMEGLGKSPAESGFANIDKSNELTDLSKEDAVAILLPRIEKVAPTLLDEQTKSLYAGMMVPYYQGGSTPLKVAVWGFALTYPISNFNQNASSNDAYFFFMTLLYCFGLLNCASTILVGENL